MMKYANRFFLSQSPLKKRLIKGLGAQGVGKVILALQRLIEVPLLLRFWGVQMYGEWLMLSALPIYIAIGDGGFTIAAVREMSMRSAAGDREGAVSIFQSIQALLLLISGGLVLLSLIVVPILPIAEWLSFITI